MSIYRKTMTDALREMYKEEVDEGTKQVLAHGGKGKYKVTKDGDTIEIKFGGKVVGTADFDRGADSFFVSIKGEKGQKSFDDAQAIADYFAKNKITEEVELDEVFNGTKKDIRKIARATDNALKKRSAQIQKMLKSKTNEKGRGLTDFEFDHISDEGDAIAAELVYRKRGGKDPISDDIPPHLKKFVNEEVELEDLTSMEASGTTIPMSMKTGQSVKRGHVPKGMYGRAAKDARRAMSKDKDFSRKDRADDDESASADDIKGASKNIMMQMRKAVSMRGDFKVEFEDKKKIKIPLKVAQTVQKKYNSLKKPADKEKFQAQVAKSYKDMLKVLKAGYNEQKESIFDRIDRKIKEKKNG